MRTTGQDEGSCFLKTAQSAVIRINAMTEVVHALARLVWASRSFILAVTALLLAIRLAADLL
jgi:hypothetical protein